MIVKEEVINLNMAHRVWFQDNLRKLNISQETFLILLAVIIGFFVGSLAVVFKLATNWLASLAFGHGESLLDFIPQYYMILIPIIGGIVVGLIVQYGGHNASGHGIPEAIQAVALKGGRMKVRTIFAEGLASLFTIGFGGSAGRVGPVVEIGGGIGSLVGQFFDMRNEVVQLLLGCGAAAGIAAIFNTPIAGVIFALEIVLGNFTSGHFSILVISSVSADFVARTVYGDKPALTILYPFQFNYSEILLYLGLGILGALMGLIFIYTLYRVEDLFKKMPITPTWLKPALGGGIVGLIGFYLPQIFGTGFGEIEQILRGQYGVAILIGILILKLLATSITLGSGLSGGVFAPTLLIGASLGGLYGHLVNNFLPLSVEGTPGTYALIGMGTVFASVSHAPITAVMMIFEMTRSYQIVIPLVVASVIANLLSRAIIEDNIYTLKLRRRGVIIQEGFDIARLMDIQIELAMSKQVAVVVDEEPLKSVVKMMEISHHNGYPVVDDEGHIVGIITAHDLRKVDYPRLNDTEVGNVMTKDLKLAYPDQTLDKALFQLVENKIDRIPIVSRENPKQLVGIITRKDIVNYYQQSLLTKGNRI